jgi:hypothetical protein
MRIRGLDLALVLLPIDPSRFCSFQVRRFVIDKIGTVMYKTRKKPTAVDLYLSKYCKNSVCESESETETLP